MTLILARSSLINTAVLIACCLLTQNIHGNGAWSRAPALKGTFYVSPDGDDYGTGSAKKPWRTLQHAVLKAGPGSTVYVQSGVYVFASAITSAVNGTPEQRIRFISEKRWHAKLKSTEGGYNAVWINMADFIDIEGFDITGLGSIGIWNKGSHVRIVGNHVHDIPGVNGCISSGAAGIDNGNYSASDNDVIANVVNDIGAGGPGSCNKYHGIYHANAGGHVWNNIVFHNSGWGIATWHAARSVVIANNTIVVNGGKTRTGLVGGGILIGDGDAPGRVLHDDSVVANNIIYQNGGIGLREYGRVGKRNRYLNNLIAANGQDTALLFGKLENGISCNPAFVLYTGTAQGDYHLKRNSPAINTGTSTAAPPVDFDGKPRPSGHAVDIGAYEYPN